MTLPVINIDAINSLEAARNAIETLVQFCLKQQEKIAQLEAEIARLKGQPRKPHFLAAPSPLSSSVSSLLKQQRSWKKRSKGTIPIDHHQPLPEVEQCTCGNTQFQSLRTFTKVVCGIVFARRNVAYHGKVKQCTVCGKRYKSPIPASVQGISFDQSLRTFLSYAKYACRMTQPLLQRLLAGIGIEISHGEIDQILLKNGHTLQSAWHHLKRVGFRKSAHLQSDATGAKRKDNRSHKILNQYVQVIGNRWLSLFAITRHYNTTTLRRFLGMVGRQKPFVSDDGSANGQGLGVRLKQVCWVHEIRHYRKLFPAFTKHRELQSRILGQFSQFYHLAKAYGRDPTMKMRRQLGEQFDQITTQKTGYGLLDHQLGLTRRKRDRLLLFLDYPKVPIHNNQSEQDLREFVIQRKISRETKSVAGDKSLVRHLSVIQTAQKQGLDVMATLQGLLTGELSPAILTANFS